MSAKTTTERIFTYIRANPLEQKMVFGLLLLLLLGVGNLGASINNDRSSDPGRDNLSYSTVTITESKFVYVGPRYGPRANMKLQGIDYLFRPPKGSYSSFFVRSGLPGGNEATAFDIGTTLAIGTNDIGQVFQISAGDKTILTYDMASAHYKSLWPGGRYGGIIVILIWIAAVVGNYLRLKKITLNEHPLS